MKDLGDESITSIRLIDQRSLILIKSLQISYHIAILKLKLSKTHDSNVFSIQPCSEAKRKGWRAVLEASAFLSKIYATLLLFHIVNILYTGSK